ncbi:MAG TPA: serine/threonine-protein kinase [Gemmataceae bacterium]|nr:serine/threonine-protein kinase [Gemmataceae bacterium]
MAIKLFKPSPKKLGIYELLNKVGEGGMGAVYKGRDTRDGTVVAIKVVSEDSAKNTLLVERFKQEYRALKSLNHPHIVRGLHFGVEEKTPYMVMEFVDGESLGDRIERVGKLPENEAIAIIAQVAEALHLAHKNQIIHRDVKPDNILVTSSNLAKLTDLGLVKNWQSDLDLTRPSSGLGTPNFMAPEQFGDAKHADGRCDLYSLGATLYMTITGEVPFRAKTNLNILKKKLQNDLTRPRQIVPEINARVEEAIVKAMSANPDSRFADCLEFVKALNNALAPAAQTREIEKAPAEETVRPEKKGTGSGRERRAAARYSCRIASTCQPMARVKERSWTGKVQDISTTGICLVLGRRFEPGTILTAELQGKRRINRSTRLVRVLRVFEQAKGKFSVACAFQQPLSDSELNVLI